MTLLELLHLIRKKLALVIVLPLLFAAGTAGYSWGFMTDDYTSEVSLYILTKSTSENDEVVTSSDLTASQQLANDIAVLAKSNRIINATCAKLGLTNLDDYKVDVSSATTNRVITLSVVGKNPEAVAMVADELAGQTSDVAVDIMDLKAVNIVDAATVPLLPSGPNRLLFTCLALEVGLIEAVALIVLLDLLNTKIRNPEDAEELLHMTVVGRFPALKGKD